MSVEKMIDTATGASPPQSHRRDMASSPIRFYSSIELMPTENFDQSSGFDNQEKQKKKENFLIKNRNFNNDQVPSLSLPFNYSSSSSDNTPVLSSTSSIGPRSLMDLQLNNKYGFEKPTTLSSTITKKNENWPFNYTTKYGYRHHSRRYRKNYVQPYRSNSTTSSSITRNNCHHCNCYHHCF